MKIAPLPPLSEKEMLRFRNYLPEQAGDGCWIWRGTISIHGRATYRLKSIPRNASRIAWRYFHNEDPGSLYVCHTCDNPLCVNPAHLYLGTAKDNVRDMVERGRKTPLEDRRGIRNPNVKLTAREVREIRKSSDPRKILASRYAVSLPTITKIQNRAIWTGLPD